MEATEHKLGRLIIKEEGMHMIDLIVITALIVQEHSEEGRLAVRRLFIDADFRLKWPEGYQKPRKGQGPRRVVVKLTDSVYVCHRHRIEI